MLVFADNAHDARKMSYGYDWHDKSDTPWIDWVAVQLYRLNPELRELDTGEPRVISSPPSCEYCHCWNCLGDCQNEADWEYGP
jgi:hypothetical protein